MDPLLGRNFEALDPLEWLARMSDHIPDPGQQRGRGKRRKAAAPPEPSSPDEAPEGATTPEGAHRAALRHRWAKLIRRGYEVDPLVCPRCGGEMRVIGFIPQPALSDRLLDHLRKPYKVSRPPPYSLQPVASPV